MSRLNAYINTDRMEREDVDVIMQDGCRDIYIYRYTDLSDDDGFRKQVPTRDLRLIKVVRGRIDRRDAIYKPTKTDSSTIVTTMYLATIYTKSLKTDDVLEYNGQRFTVRVVSKIGQGYTEAEVEILS